VVLAGLSLTLLSVGHVHSELEAGPDACAACCVHVREGVALSCANSTALFVLVVTSLPTLQCIDPHDLDRRSACESRGPPQSKIAIAG
jgi:hypothetical protein